MIQHVFEVKKQTHRRRATSDDTTVEVQTLPLQRRNTKRHKTDVLTYHFSKRGDSKEIDHVYQNIS